VARDSSSLEAVGKVLTRKNEARGELSEGTSSHGDNTRQGKSERALRSLRGGESLAPNKQKIKRNLNFEQDQMSRHESNLQVHSKTRSQKSYDAQKKESEYQVKNENTCRRPREKSKENSTGARRETKMHEESIRSEEGKWIAHTRSKSRFFH
jgi:hypothetical protein